MHISFGEALRRLRMEQGLSQQQLADKMHMDRSGIAHWESGRRVPDVVMLSRLSECLGLELSVLMRTAEGLDERPKVILVDDEKLILNGAIPILEEAMPGAEVAGFTIPSRALAYAIVVEDTGPGFAPSDDDEPHIALANIRERLEMICRGTLTVRPREGRDQSHGVGAASEDGRFGQL